MKVSQWETGSYGFKGVEKLGHCANIERKLVWKIASLLDFRFSHADHDGKASVLGGLDESLSAQVLFNDGTYDARFDGSPGVALGDGKFLSSDIDGG